MSESIFDKIKDKQIDEAKKRIGKACSDVMTTFKDCDLSLGEIEIVIGECQRRLREASTTLKFSELLADEEAVK
jgi:hypothetical protein